MDLQTLAQEITAGEWDDLIAPYGASEALKMKVAEIHERLIESCALVRGPVAANCWFDIYWTASWVKALHAARLPADATVLEVGAGLSTNFVRAADHVLRDRGKFIAVNLNQNLTISFKRRNRRLAIPITFLGINARDLDHHFPAGSCGFVALNHEINDIVQTILFEAEGRATEGGDWFTMVPEMIRLVAEARETGALEQVVRPEFLQIIHACTRVLQPGGVMGFNNSITSLLLRFGYTEELLGSFIPLARRWIAEGIEDLHEETIDGFDEKWWLFFRKK